MQVTMTILFVIIVVIEVKGLQRGVLIVVLLLLVNINKIQIEGYAYDRCTIKDFSALDYLCQ